MAVHYRTEGFVFKAENVLEADRVFFIFTKDFGRVELVGKSIRKITSKLRGGIEVFSFSEIEFIHGKKKKTLTDALFISRFKDIARTPEKLNIAYRISSLLDGLIRGQEKDENILKLLDEVFSILSNISLPVKNCNLLYSYFFWNFAKILGYGPELFICAGCGTRLDPSPIFFSNKEGGVICKACAAVKKDSLPIGADMVKILRFIIRKEWGVLLRVKSDKVLENSLMATSENYGRYLLHSHGLSEI